MLAGFTSRCTSPAACAASSADATAETIAAARPADSGPSRRSSVRTSPPGTYRIAMNSTPPASPASNTGIMCGSSTAAAARDSRRNRPRNSASAASAGARTFSATGRPSRSSRARNTTAIPPSPTCSSRRYPATREPAVTPAGKPLASPRTSPPTEPPHQQAHPTLASRRSPAPTRNWTTRRPERPPLGTPSIRRDHVRRNATRHPAGPGPPLLASVTLAGRWPLMARPHRRRPGRTGGR